MEVSKLSNLFAPLPALLSSRERRQQRVRDAVDRARVVLRRDRVGEHPAAVVVQDVKDALRDPHVNLGRVEDLIEPNFLISQPDQSITEQQIYETKSLNGINYGQVTRNLSTSNLGPLVPVP